MSTKTKIFIGVIVLAIVVITIIVLKYSKTKAPSVETTTSTSSTSGLAAAGGLGGLGGMLSMLGLSDERYKKILSDGTESAYGDSYEVIDSINPIMYSFTHDSEGHTACPTCFEGSPKQGYSAQQLESVDKNLVYTDPKSGIKYVDYSQIIAHNTGAIKSIMEEHAYLKGLLSSDAVQGAGPTNNRVL
jgi:hypothetical protein